MQKRIKARVRLGDSHVLNENELAERWDISHRTLQNWRCSSMGPIYLKLGNRVGYRLSDVHRYERESLRRGSGERVHG